MKIFYVGVAFFATFELYLKHFSKIEHGGEGDDYGKLGGRVVLVVILPLGREGCL